MLAIDYTPVKQFLCNKYNFSKTPYRPPAVPVICMSQCTAQAVYANRLQVTALFARVHRSKESFVSFFTCISNGLTVNLISICQANYFYILYKNSVLPRRRYANRQNWQMLMNRYFSSTCSKRLSYVYFLFSFDLKAVQKCQYKFSVSWTCVVFLWYLLRSQLQQSKLVRLKPIPRIIS